MNSTLPLVIVSQENGTLVCQGVVTSKHGTRFLFTDRFLAGNPDSFELRRNIVIHNEILTMADGILETKSRAAEPKVPSAK